MAVARALIAAIESHYVPDETETRKSREVRTSADTVHLVAHITNICP